jgi:ribonuclease J
MPSLTFYGGVDEIGGSKILLQDSGTALFFDFGISFSRRYKYFEEYLKPRPGAGLLDLLEMELLPPLLSIYRQDLVADNEPWQRFKLPSFYQELHIDGVLLSHAHVDHSGHISFLKEEIPIYTTAMSAFIAKAMQDSGPTDFEREVCYLNPRKMRGGYLSPEGPYCQRQFIFVDGLPLSEEAKSFWQESPAKTKALNPCKMPTTGDQVGSLKFRHFPVDHSIFGTSAFAVETSLGWIGYTGDLRLHGKGANLTQHFIQELNSLKPYILLCEGTRAGRETHPEAAEATEEDVYQSALEATRETKGLVIADFGPRNVERLLIFHQIAQQSSRRLVILAKDAYLLEAMHLVSPEVPELKSSPDILIYQDLKARPDNWENKIRQERYLDKMVAAPQVHSSPGDYILCFSFWDAKNLIDIDPQGGTYIYSTSEAYNEEQIVDLWRLHNWVEHFNMRFVGDPDTGDRRIHASGHASGAELLELIRAIKPQILIPIHTEEPSYFVRHLEGTGIEVNLPEYGKEMKFL